LNLSYLGKNKEKVNDIAMSKKRKRDRAEQEEDWIGEGKTFVSKPFEGLSGGLQGSDKKAGPVSSPCSANTITEQTDEDLFKLAMKDVVPLKDNRRKKIVRSPVSKEKLADGLPGHRAKVREDLACLFKESAAWDISFSDEYMEGAVSGVGSKIMKRLKRGEFSIQDYIDLHGLRKSEAETVVNNFLVQSYQKGARCVLIVHGRGLGSVGHQPAIKTELPTWFRRGILKRIVLAFVTARPCDGGAGALYVLLKKR
jgi:DNA-nicking Smr family endonuclease